MAGVRQPEELDVWKLSAALRDRIYPLLSSGPVSRDFKFCDQIRDSSASAPRNIAEGFGHFNPREIARFTRIARASLFETRDHLQHALTQGYLSADQAADLRRLNDRAIGAATAFLAYLDRCNGKAPTGWGFKRPRRREP